MAAQQNLRAINVARKNVIGKTRLHDVLETLTIPPSIKRQPLRRASKSMSKKMSSF
jgi:hypothetical protein